MFSRQVCDKIYDQFVVALIIFVLIVVPHLVESWM